MPPAMLHDRNIIITHPPGPVYQVGNDTPHFNIVQGVPFQRLTIISDQRLPADNSEFSFPGICDKDMITLLWPAADCRARCAALRSAGDLLIALSPVLYFSGRFPRRGSTS